MTSSVFNGRDPPATTEPETHALQRELHILHLEDNEDDVALVEHELHREGVRFWLDRVETEREFSDALERSKPDVILADCRLPTFDGHHALAIAQEQTPGVPFIFVSGTMGEELAVESMRRGATDYVLKDRLWRLGPVLRRALAEVEEAARAWRAEEETRRIEGLRSDERRRAEAELALRSAELERSNRDLEQFAYAASHDLSEPLRAIAGPISLLARRHAGCLDAEADQLIGFALDGCGRMQQIIDGLLAFSRVGRLEDLYRPVDTAALVEAARRALSEAIEESGATVSVDPLPTVAGEPSQLGQVFQNALANAVKFHAPGVAPAVQVGAHRVGDRWRFTVSDDGIGIDPAQRDRVFGMFKRLHSRQEYPGTGLGLALCQRIVERHGGEIGIEDGPGGRGTTLWFTLPAGPPADGER